MSIDTSKSSNNSTHYGSISNWIDTLQTRNLGSNKQFSSSIIAEEHSKIDRLQHLKKRIGLPIYETLEFDLPNQLDEYCNACSEIAKDETWNLALRFADPDHNKTFFRQLGADFCTALAIADEFKNKDGFVARVTPYRVPDMSGTLWVKRGEVTFEVVSGPHTWISKTPQDQTRLEFCWLRFPFISLKYSTNDITEKIRLYSKLRDVVRLVSGCDLRRIAEIRDSVYAEFHWHKSFGYRFIECSYSNAWTS